MFIWPAGFAATAINIAMLPREGWPAWMVKSTVRWANAAIASRHRLRRSGVSVLRRRPLEFHRQDRSDRRRGGLSSRSRTGRRPSCKRPARPGSPPRTTGPTPCCAGIFNDRVPVIQINERGRFMGFRDPGMNSIAGHTGLYVGREPDNSSPVWKSTTAVREPLERVERSWRGVVMDTYALEKLTGWTPELSPPPDSPLYRWRVLAGDPSQRSRLARTRSRRRTAGLRVVTRRRRACAADPWRDRPSAGRGNAVNGSGRVTSIAASPSRAVKQPVENAFAEPLRQFCRDAMAEHLLDQAVACRHAAGDREMRDDVTHQPDHAERARPSAVEPRQLPDQPQRCREHEQHVDQRRAG